MADVAWRFTGAGTEHYSGVPARDLTADEYAALTEAQQARVGAGVLYARVGASAVALAFDATADDGQMTDETGGSRTVRRGKVVS